MRTKAPILSEIEKLFEIPKTDRFQEYSITIVTDAYIGSAGKEFESNVIRASSIRGHLRVLVACDQGHFRLSHPVWVRGLKSKWLRDAADKRSRSHPVWVRGLK